MVSFVSKTLARSFGCVLELATRKCIRESYILRDAGKVLNDGAKEMIMEDFFPLALLSYRQVDSNQWFRDAVKSRMFGSRYLVLVFDDELPIGFRAYDEFYFNGKKVAYIRVTAIDTRYQREGIALGLHNLLDDDIDYVTCRTQNPVIVDLYRNKFGNAHPFFYESGSNGEVEAKDLALHISEGHESIDSYNYEKMVVRGVYNHSSLYLTRYLSDDPSTQKKMDDLIDYDNGDAVIVVSKVNRDIWCGRKDNLVFPDAPREFSVGTGFFIGAW